jgi:hypothetical protein
MSDQDHDQKLPDDRLGRYTLGARLPADDAEAPARFDDPQPRSWEARADDDARPRSFSGADVTAYGQLVGGASDQVGGGFGGANVGGYGQQGLGSQWGKGGFGPLTQGANYSGGGTTFGPPGFSPYPEGAAARGGYGSTPGPRGGAYERPSPTPLFGSPKDFGGSAHDPHEPHYRHWRDAKLAAHDQDYARWRDEQARRYDEDYRTWRNTHHSAFSQAFEGWRDQRTTSATPSPFDLGDPGAVHGANPTLGNIADGGTGAPRHGHDHKHEERAASVRPDEAD